MNRPRILDLFSGAGGMALGFRAAGAHCLGGVDANAAAGRTFASMFAPDEPVVFGGAEGDVNDLTPVRLLGSLRGSPDVVVGGPPCQGFSRIGRAKHASLLDSQSRVLLGGQGDPGRNLLYRYLLAVVAEARPMAFVMENVPGMKSILGVDHATRIAREAATLGYNVRYFLLNAAFYGVPQNRWRLFFVGLRRDLGSLAIPAPPPRRHLTDGEPLQMSGLPDDDWYLKGRRIPGIKDPAPSVTVGDALRDLPRLKQHLEGGVPAGGRQQYRHSPRAAYARLMRAWPGLPPTGDTVTGNWYRSNDRDYGTFAAMAQGDRYPEALAHANRRFQEHLIGLGSHAPEPRSPAYEELEASFVPPYRNDAFDDKWRKLVLNRPSWTVTAHLKNDCYSHIHYDSRQARTITIREAARLQSFPDAFHFEGNYGEQFQQIGNAVPPLLGWAIAEQVLGQLVESGAFEGWQPNPLPRLGEDRGEGRPTRRRRSSPCVVG